MRSSLETLPGPLFPYSVFDLFLIKVQLQVRSEILLEGKEEVHTIRPVKVRRVHGIVVFCVWYC